MSCRRSSAPPHLDLTGTNAKVMMVARAPGPAAEHGLGSSLLSPPAGVITGGPERWLILAEGKNSDQLVDVLLEEIGSALLREKDFFPGLVGESLSQRLLKILGELSGALSCLHRGPD